MSEDGFFVLEYEKRLTWQRHPVTREKSYKIEDVCRTLQSHTLEEAKAEAMAIVENELRFAYRWNREHLKMEEKISRLSGAEEQKVQERRDDCVVQMGPFHLYFREPSIELHGYYGCQETKTQLASASP